MKLLTDELKRTLPALYSLDGCGDPIVCAKFFCPWSNWTWFVLEGEIDLDENGDEVDFVFYGLVVGFEREFGYFNLEELQAVKGPAGLTIERDLYFEPKPLSQCEKLQL